MAKIASKWNEGKHCKYVVDERTGKTCNAPFVVDQTEIEIDPTQQGPKGGKVWVCAHHVHGASENPFTNAGRRTKRGKAAVYAKGAMKGKPRKPRMTAAAVPEGYYMGMSLGPRDKVTKEFTGPLARLAASRDAGARAEIARRERSVEKGGVKMSWTVEKPKKAKKAKKAAANPFSGYGFYY